MPDWSYQTVFRPILTQFEPRRGRDLALGFMGRLASVSLGRRIIQMMGHMTPDSRLSLDKGGLHFPTRCGLGADFDPRMTALPAFAEFGFGFLEVGPIVADPSRELGNIEVDQATESIQLHAPFQACAPIQVADRLSTAAKRPTDPPIIARIEPNNADEARVMVEMLQPHVAAFAIDESRVEFMASLDVGVPILLRAPADPGDIELLERLAEKCRQASYAGVICTGSTALDEASAAERQTFGAPLRAAGLEFLTKVREAVGPDRLVIAATGIHAPADALHCLDAGADLVAIDSGLVFAGPGLPKRVNEAHLYDQLMREELREPTPPTPSPPTPGNSDRIGGYSWFWALVMGLSMMFGGVLALLIAATCVVLPYDESMSELTREKLLSINTRLLSFMTHDRVTLSGTMLAVGIQYAVLSWWGVRRGIHWAYVSILVSAFAGACSFFAFLGFGYFDPFHAFVTSILFQFLLLTFHSKLIPRRELTAPDLWNNATWKRNLWGQLMFVVHGAVLIFAGSVITKVGMTSVFVPEDLEFMHTSAQSLHEHPKLVPLVAHDRATFGGMLISCGFATLLPALWGFRRGQNWLWWALVTAGSIAYLATIIVHWAVGYTSLKHLLPAYGGLAWLWVGGLLSYHHLVGRDQALETAWNERLRTKQETSNA